MRVSGISALGPFHGSRRLPPFPSPGVNVGDFCTFPGFLLSLEGTGTFNTQVCSDLRCCSSTVRFSAHQGPGSPARMLWTQVSKSLGSQCQAVLLSGPGFGVRRLPVYQEEPVSPPVVASDPGRKRFTVIYSLGIHEGLSLCGAQE